MFYTVTTMSIFFVDTRRASRIIVGIHTVGGNRVPPSASEVPMKTRKMCADCGRIKERDETACTMCGGRWWQTASHGTPGQSEGPLVRLATETPLRTLLAALALFALLWLVLVLGRM
jgi:hypothetical protein